MKRTATFGVLAALMVGAGAVEKSTLGTSKDFKGPVGLQLYSLRNEFAKDVPGTMAKVRAMGFKYVETAGTYNLSTADFRRLLDVNGLKAISGHFPYERYKTDVEGIARDAKAIGLAYVGCAWIPHEGTFDEKECREAISVFSKAGEALVRHRLKFFYHIHGYEFQPFEKGTLFDLMVSQTKASHVRFQLDTFWALHPGYDPVKLIQKHGPRWELMHLKDMRHGVKLGDLSGHSDDTNCVVLGTGQMDWPAILKASSRSGVKWYFIEDEAPDAGDQIPQSLRYLETIKFPAKDAEEKK
jgi:sugar phosphate isomerase/epimerase